FHVTGVQTCALPISAWRITLEQAVADHAVACPLGGIAPTRIVRPAGQRVVVHFLKHWLHDLTDALEHLGHLAATAHLIEHLKDRSEERRVGKESRYR